MLAAIIQTSRAQCPVFFNCVNKTVLALLLMLAASTAVAETQTSSETLKVYDDWGGDFGLTDHNGFPLRLSDFAGKVVLLSFGYTHCPDVCPATMFTMKRVIKALGDAADKVQILFVTLDPERDKPERLRAYMEYFDPGFIALGGSVSEIKKVTGLYGIRFEKEEADAEGNYSIAHSAVIYLIDQQGRIRVFFKVNAPAGTIADGVRMLLESSE